MLLTRNSRSERKLSSRGVNTFSLAKGSERGDRQESIHSQDSHEVEKSCILPPKVLFQRWCSGGRYEPVTSVWGLAKVT